MGLSTYWKKRDFKKTSEPSGKRAATGAKRGRKAAAELAYVIQKHAATRLHYDFRLELDGVLKSWAVPKGPSFDPDERRLAVEVEDHPMDYGSFEGTIPKGEYGGGTVVLWDRGVWIPEEDPREGLRKGKLKFTLRGEKLNGRFTLVRMGGRAAGEDAKNWLLFKDKDEFAHPLSEGDILEERPESIKTGRSMDEIAAGEEPRRRKPGVKKAAPRTPRASRTSRTSKAKRTPKAKRTRRRAEDSGVDPSAIAGARRAGLPEAVEPELATLVDQSPAGDGWIYELKYDGYRVLVWIADGSARFITRNGNDWTTKFTAVTEAIEALPVKEAILDGEIVVLQQDGTTDFQALQNALREGSQANLTYFAFDLLFLDGYDLREARLIDRKIALSKVLAAAPPDSRIRYSEHLEGDGKAVFMNACKLALEGVVAKRGESSYRGGRVNDWLKLKCGARQELVIGGYTDPTGSRNGIGALLVGYHDKDRSLHYCGKVGTGFNNKTLNEMAERLASIERDSSPFADPPRMRGVHWVAPKLVAEVEFTAWTNGGHLRHPSFQGLRADKDPRTVVRETPKHVTTSAPGARGKERAAVAVAAGEDIVSVAPAARRSASMSAKKKPAEPAPSRNAVSNASAAWGRRKRANSAEVAGITLSNPAKVLYPEKEITKLDLALYYESVADWMLPYIQKRPLTLVRCPEGCGKPCFFQKHSAKEAGIGEAKTVQITEKDGPDTCLYIDSTAGLISLVQMGALELHVWGSRIDDIEHPDLIVFDLDPGPEVPWSSVVEAARSVRDRLLDLGLESFVRTTGGKGLHVVSPIGARSGDWSLVKEFTKAFAEAMEKDEPSRYVSNMAKAKRVGKIFVDYLRNGRGATAITTYSTRARPGATVATPLAWDELDAKTEPERYNVQTVPKRLARLKEDPWAELSSTRQSITAAMRRRLGLR